jgi:succinyl-diaminopimelate desuccinylase
MTSSPLLLAQSLLRCPSVTPEEGGALAFIESVLKEAGFEVHRPVFSEPGTPDVENLYARYGRTEPYLLFAGHTDVVPPGDAGHWAHDPFSGEIHGGELYGRGAVDMKGGIACMMAAALGFVRDNPGFAGSVGADPSPGSSWSKAGRATWPIRISPRTRSPGCCVSSTASCASRSTGAARISTLRTSR